MTSQNHLGHEVIANDDDQHPTPSWLRSHDPALVDIPDQPETILDSIAMKMYELKGRLQRLQKSQLERLQSGHSALPTKVIGFPIPGRRYGGPIIPRQRSVDIREHLDRWDRRDWERSQLQSGDRLLPHVRFVVTNEERIQLCRKGAMSAIRRKVVGEEKERRPEAHRHPVGSLVVRQIAPQESARNGLVRSSSAFAMTGKVSGAQFVDLSRYNRRHPSPEDPAQLVDESPSCTNEHSAGRRAQKKVHFAQGLPQIHAANTWQVNDDKLKESGGYDRQNGQKAELSLPKIDISSAIQDDIRATANRILLNAISSPRPELSSSEHVLLSLLVNKEAMGLQCGYPGNNVCQDPVYDYRPDMAERMTGAVFPVRQFVPNLSVTRASRESQGVAAPTHRASANRREACLKKARRIIGDSNCRLDSSHKSSVTLKNFKMALPGSDAPSKSCYMPFSVQDSTKKTV